MTPREKHFPIYVSSVTHFKSHELLEHAQNLYKFKVGKVQILKKENPKSHY